MELESPRPKEPDFLVSTLDENSADPVHTASEPGIVAPRQLYAPEPEFSEEARKRKEDGMVRIALVVGSDGLPKNLRVACSSWPELIPNALGSVRQWKFAPGTKDGKPVPVEIMVEISFKLH